LLIDIRLYDITAIPGLVDALRKEIEEVTKQYDGVISTKALYEMKLLDSVMKESQRMYPLSIAGVHRMTTHKGITLADGTYIPPRTHLHAPMEAIHHDPKVFSDPEVFDPYRFYNKRQTTESAGKHQFVTAGPDVLGFGYGKHACPGRFFAANEIKLILISLLQQFDIEQKDKGPRYPHIVSGDSIRVDMSRQLMFKRIKA
jgi:cytochrome P450